MSDEKKSISEILRNEDSFIYGQTNPSFHDTPEDAKNYKSLQTKTQVILKKPLFVLKPSLLTQKAEEIRTDKIAVKETFTNILGSNKFLVLDNERKYELNKKTLSYDVKFEDNPKDFVFGQDISARVINTEGSQEKLKDIQEFKDLSGETVKEDVRADVGGDALRKNAEVLSQKCQTKHFHEGEVITGEEEERSVLKINAKVFLFSNDRQEWVEKGLCFVHVNEITNSSDHKSRLVARSKGGLQVIINTFIWPQMVVCRTSEKSLRITAQNEDGLKSFLLKMLNNSDADILYRELLHRTNDVGSKFGIKGNRKRYISSSDTDDSIESKKRILSDDE